MIRGEQKRRKSKRIPRTEERLPPGAEEYSQKDKQQRLRPAYLPLADMAQRHTGLTTGADYYIGPPGQPVEDLEGCLRLEVSGTDLGTDTIVASRLQQKIRQAEAGKRNLPAMAAVVGFHAQLIMLQLVESL